MITLKVDADYSFSLMVSAPDLEIVYSGTIAGITSSAITATITAATTNGIAMTPQEIALIAGPHELSYSVNVTGAAAYLTVMGPALQVLVGSAEVTLQKQP